MPLSPRVATVPPAAPRIPALAFCCKVLALASTYASGPVAMIPLSTLLEIALPVAFTVALPSTTSSR